jgi:hypothetical protein
MFWGAGDAAVTGLVIHDREMDFNVFGSARDAAVAGVR